MQSIQVSPKNCFNAYGLHRDHPPARELKIMQYTLWQKTWFRAPRPKITEPGVNNRGLCRADDEEFQRIQNDLERMQNVAFDFLKNPRGEKPKRDDVFDAVPSRQRVFK